MRVLLAITILWCIGACAGNTKHELPAKPQALSPAAKVDNIVSEVSKKQIQLLQRQARIQRLLAQAEAALLNGRLTMPVSDNAYDRFRAVLMTDPSNDLASKGLQRILLAYAARVHQAIAAGNLPRAKRLVYLVSQHYPGDPLVAVLQSKFEVAQKSSPLPRAEQRVDPLDENTLVLPVLGLSQRSQAVKDVLIQAALRAQESDESVIIHARNDAEGRWIYKTMKLAVEGYRIRGDIRITKRPAIVFMSPLGEEEETDS